MYRLDAHTMYDRWHANVRRGHTTAGGTILAHRLDCGMSRVDNLPDDEPVDVDVSDILRQLRILEESVSSPDERREVERIKRLTERIPGSARIRKYTKRDIMESVVGGIVFCLPLLVEDGVFEIAEWFATVTVGPLPLFLTLNLLFILGLTGGVLYGTDFREVQITQPFFGIVPRRLVAVLLISFVVAAGMMLMWGRLHEADPNAIERLGRITVLWAAAALGASLGDILPGESRGTDLGSIERT